MNTLNNIKVVEQTASEREMDLEILTKRYIIGEIKLEEYKSKVSRLETRLDLRRVASKLKPILVPVRNSK